MNKPEDISQEAWDAAERPAIRIGLDYQAGQLWDVRPTIARAIMAGPASTARPSGAVDNPDVFRALEGKK